MVAQQLSRPALLYLLASFSLCNALLSIYLPWWLLLVAAVCLVWRLFIFSGRTSFPAAWLRVVLVVLSGAALLAQFGFLLSVDIFVALLLLGFSLKLLEIYQNKDAQFLLYLAVFVLMTAFLFSQSVGYAVLVFWAVALVLASLVAVQSDAVVLQRDVWHPLRRGVWLFLMALPVMLFLFVVMPRLPPLWSMPLKTQQAKTGMSDSMRFGDVASLAKSSDIAFRASFPHEVPERKSLYWYGLFLDHFDGEQWSESCKHCTTSIPNITDQKAQKSFPYQVVLEPSGQPWVYLLKPSAIGDGRMKIKPDGIIRYVDNVRERRMYEARLLFSERLVSLSAAERDQYLSLPSTGNEAARKLASQWRQGVTSDAAVIKNALDFYHASFHYTLQPPILKDDRVDDFLFNTRSGFCEHFAGSFVFLMRAAGIPARVAMGYMGGEIDSKNGFVVVRQYDAHAWAEVWLPSSGWRRIDPTAAVAPERIDLGFEGAYASNPLFAGGENVFGSRQFSLLNRLRLEMDRLDYVWSRWVLGYDNERQSAFLKKMGLLSPLRVAVWSVVGVGLMFVGVCIFLYWREQRSNKEHPATRHYRRLCDAYARKGVARLAMETPVQYASRIRAAGLPYAEQFERLSAEYYEWMYNNEIKEKKNLMISFGKDCYFLCFLLFIGK